MAAKLTNSEKNARARAKYVEELAKANQKNIGAVQGQIDKQRTAWQGTPSSGNDIVVGDREAPSRVFTPKKAGGGTLKTPDGKSREVTKTELELARDTGQSYLQASGSAGKAKTGATGQSFGDVVGEVQKDIAGAADGGDGIDVANAYLAGGGKLAGKVAPWLVENMGEQEAPQNLGQWLINLLSTGTYVGANAVEGVADAVNATKKRTEERNAKGDTIGASLSGLQGLGESIVNPIRYGARGIGEGLGFRYDGDGDGKAERPKTHGQNLEDLGTADGLKSALGEKGGQFAQGALGTAADIAGDPLTFATLGLTGVGRGAIEGAAEAAAKAGTGAEKVVAGAAGAVKGGWQGAAARRTDIANERFRSWQARQVRRDSKTLSPEEFAAKWGGTDMPELSPQLALPAGRPAEAADAGDLGDAPAFDGGRTFVGGRDGLFEPADMDLRSEQLALPATASDYRPKVGSVEEAQAAWRASSGTGPDAAAAATLRATDELLPQLQRTVTPEVNTPGILQAALAAGTRVEKRRLLSPEATVTMQGLVDRAVKAAAEGDNPQRTTRGLLAKAEADPELASRLEHQVDADGTTLRDVLTAALSGHKASRKQLGKIAATEVDETIPTLNTPALREAIDAANPGLRDGLGIAGSKLHKLVYRLARTADPAKQQEILQGTLGRSYTEGYGTFRDALAGVARGELAPEQMQQMLAALGVRTRATKPATLKELLSTKGAQAYDDALARIPSPEEINRVFNVTPAVAEAAARVDPVAEIDQAKALADEQVAATPGAENIPSVEFPATIIDEPMAKAPKPPVIPAKRPSEITADQLDSKGGQLDPVGKGAYAGVRTLGRLLREAVDSKGAGNTLSSYTDEVTVAVSRAVVDQIKMKYLKKGGADRAERFTPRYLEAMHLVESWAWGKGMIPHLVDNANGTGDIWVSTTQVLELLDPDVLGAAMFAPLKNRKTAAAEGAIGYVNGMTVYPNHIMTGLKVALSGGDASQVAQAIIGRATGASRGMQRGTDRYVKSFAETAEGKAAIQNLADELVRPDVLDQVRAIDARVKPVAEAINQRYIDNVVAKAGERIMQALRDGGDRGTLMGVLREVSEWADDAAQPAMLDADRISASVRERLDSAIVKGVLGEDGFLTAQHDWEFATAVERVTPSQRMERQAAALAREEARLKRQNPKPQTTPPAEPVAERGRVAQAAEQEILDAEQAVRTEARVQVEAEVGRPLREEADEALWREVDNRAAANLFEAVGKRTSGRFGQQQVWGIRTSAEEGTLAQAAAYSANMRKWVRGVATRMSRELGTKITTAQALDHLNGPIYRALAATDPANWGQRGKLYTELVTGRDVPDATRAALTEDSTFDALSDFDAQLALELHRFIDHVWNPGETGLLGRSGLTAADVVDSSKWYLRGDDEPFRLDAGEKLVDQAQKWRAWGGATSPLDILDRHHQAIQAALVPQQIGHQMSAMFSGKQLRPGVSNKQLYAEGWRRVDTGAARNVGRFVDPDAYFPPEVLSQLRYLDEFLAASRGFDPEGNFGKYVVRPYDAITRVFKSSNTIWRPGHHVTNVLGETGMLLMAGVNPLQAIRGLKTIRAGGGILDADMSVLDQLARESIGQKVPDPKFADESVRIVLRDGRGGHKVQDVPLSQVWQWAVNSGVALTHTAARDLVENVADGIAPSFWHSNPVAQADEALGRFSAHRDNVTRIAHFIDALEKGTYANLDDARGAAATKVHDFHPTVRTLSRWEQKYARRLVFFYTWVRQAISRVLRTALDQPGFVTMPFKAQYNLAEAAGLNPESIGGPTTDDPRIASYTRHSLIGPTFAMDPDGDGGELAADLWSMSLSQPQIDTLQTLFGTFNAVPGDSPDEALDRAGTQAATLGADVLNPIIGTPLKRWAESQKFGDTGKSTTEILAESAGAPTAVARFLPAGEPNPTTGGPQSVFSALFPESSGADDPADEQASNMTRYLLNYLTGLKFQNTTTDAATSRAKTEQRERLKREGEDREITDPDQISEIHKLLWDWKLQNQLRGQ